MTWADQILPFLKNLNLEVNLPSGVRVMNPYRGKNVYSLCEKFYKRYYNDSSPRTLILGINPGRNGGGITGIPFTDPIKLEALGLSNDLQKKPELSSGFIYTMIDSFGGPDKFYNKFYISSVSPLGFTQHNKNLNYYDLKNLPALLGEFIKSCLEQQLAWGLNRKVSFCLGEGKNFDFLKKLNDQHRYFENITPLPHPRFVMQYRRKKLKAFIKLYVDKFNLG